MKKVTLILAVLIFILSLGLRTVSLDKIPVSLTIDEVAVAYNAYSILKTGKDEYGTSFPLAFRSIGDYKAPLLIYMMVPAVYLFGLNEFGTRVTVSFFGALTVLVVFLLSRKLSKSDFIGLFTSLSLAISPWHIKFSRSTFEAILGLFFVVLGVYVFLIAMEKKGKFLWLSAILFCLSAYSYHAERVFTPLFVLALGVIYRKELIQNKRNTLISLVVGVLVILPLVITLLSPKATVRAQSTFITRDFELNKTFHKEDEQRSLGSYIFDNNFLISINFWAKRYLEYLDPNFLFIKGMGYTLPNTPDTGLLYLIELPFFILGFYLLVFKKYLNNSKYRLIILSWLILGPLAASLANNAQHALRSLTWILVPQFLTALGIFYLYGKIKVSLRKIFLTFYILVLIFGVGYFINLYGVSYQMFSSEYAMDGWKEAAKFALENQNKYEEIVVDPRFGTQGPYTVGTPYLYILFYGQIDPVLYQTDSRRKEFETSSNFKNFTFREIDWAEGEGSDKGKKDVLFIGSGWVLPAEDDKVIKKFYLLNGKEILRAVGQK